MALSTASMYEDWITERWFNYLSCQNSVDSDPSFKNIKQRLLNAIVVTNEDIMEGCVQFGSIVTVFSVDEEEEQTFQIVSADEARSAQGLLDPSCPLAQAVIGAREGETVVVKLKNGSNCDYEVTHIRVPV